MEESGRIDMHEDDAARMAERRVVFVPVVAAGALLSVNDQPKFGLMLFSGHYQVFAANVLMVLLSREPVPKMAKEIGVAVAQLLVGGFCMGMLIASMSFT